MRRWYYRVMGTFIIPATMYPSAMFDEIPEEVPAQYLSGAAAFVRSGGERDEDLEKSDFAYVLNEITGHARVPAPGDARANTRLVSKDSDEFDPEEAFGASQYDGGTIGAEVEAWARWAVEHADE